MIMVGNNFDDYFEINLILEGMNTDIVQWRPCRKTPAKGILPFNVIVATSSSARKFQQ